jgi:DNA-binding MarR family transcriptional regulator
MNKPRNDLQLLVLALCVETGGITARELSAETECGYSTACAVLAILEAHGMIERVLVGHAALFGITLKGRAVFAKMPVIDTEERPIYLVGFDALE